MTVVEAEQTTHPTCAPQAGAEVDATSLRRALLSLAASGVAETVVEGQPDDDAALWLGRLWGRRRGAATVEADGQRLTYAWPADWQRLLDDSRTWRDFGSVSVDRELRHAAPRNDQALADPVRWLS